MEGKFICKGGDIIIFIAKNGPKFNVDLDISQNPAKVLPFFTYHVKEDEEIPNHHILGDALGIKFKDEYSLIIYRIRTWYRSSVKMQIQMVYNINKEDIKTNTGTNVETEVETDIKEDVKTNVETDVSENFAKIEPVLMIFKNFEISLKDFVKLSKIPHYDFFRKILKDQIKEKLEIFNTDVLSYVTSIPPAPLNYDKDNEKYLDKYFSDSENDNDHLQ